MSSLLRGDSRTLPRLLAFVAVASGASRTVLIVQIVLFDIVDDLFRYEVANGHVPTPEQSNLRRADVVLYQLLDDPDVVFPGLKRCKCFVDICTRSLQTHVSIGSDE